MRVRAWLQKVRAWTGDRFMAGGSVPTLAIARQPTDVGPVGSASVESGLTPVELFNTRSARTGQPVYDWAELERMGPDAVRFVKDVCARAEVRAPAGCLLLARLRPGTLGACGPSAPGAASLPGDGNA